MESSRGFLPCSPNPVLIIKPRFALGQLLIFCVGIAHFVQLSYLRPRRIFTVYNSASCVTTEAFYRLAIDIICADYLVSFHFLTSFLIMGRAFALPFLVLDFQIFQFPAIIDFIGIEQNAFAIILDISH